MFSLALTKISYTFNTNLAFQVLLTISMELTWKSNIAYYILFKDVTRGLKWGDTKKFFYQFQ